MTLQQLGVIGLGTMGANLARNAARNGARVVLFNRTTEKTHEFMEHFSAEGEFVATESLRQFVSEMASPRAMLLMVKAGDAVDAVMEELLPMLSKGDILIDAGNSHYRDTERREMRLKKLGMHFVGMGVSGGEEGALMGPSMMPGGDPDALRKLMPLLLKMAASDGSTRLTTGSAKGKCVTYIGPGGAGHFVKMVHNGIEYGIMQLIAESYDLLKSMGKLKNADLAKVFTDWSKSDDLGSFLIEITAKIFAKKDPDTKKDLIDVIGDVAGQKGTGKWTTETAMDLGIAIPTINAAVDARILSGETEHRARRMKQLPVALPKTGKISHAALVSMVRSALELSIICTYAQGFELMAKMSNERKWNFDLAEIARIWRGGCIIRSKFLTILQPAQTGNVAAEKAVLKRMEGKRQSEWRQLIAHAVLAGIPVPAMSASLWFYDTLRRERLPQNLIQAQRDFFGAHGYKRIDKAGDFHTRW